MNDSSDSTALRRTLAPLGVLPVVELPSVDSAVPLAEALLAAGCRVAEITLRSAAGLAALPLVRAACPDILLGAGTVRTTTDVRQAVDAGARFIVSPGTKAEVVALSHDLGVPAVPGVCTPTEMEMALGAGADIVKFFPAEAMGGLAAIAAMAGPFPDVAIIPTGGINQTNLASYLRLRNVLACGGSWLVSKDLLVEARFDMVTSLAREALAIATEAASGGTVAAAFETRP